MSALLDSLLDAARRSTCALNDAASSHHPFCFTTHRETDMRHGVCSPARSFAALDASVAVDNGRDFHITILRLGKPEETYVERFAGDLEASFDAIVRGGEGAVLIVRPFIESTYGEGMSAYPRELHRDANSAAQAGWDMAQYDEQRRQTERRAIQFVMRQPSIEATVWGAA